MKKCVGLLYRDLEFDSRAKRAFAAIASVTDFVAVVTRCRDASKYSYSVHSLRVPMSKLAALFFFIRSLIFLFRQKPDLVYAEGLVPLVPAAIYGVLRSAQVVYDGRELYLRDKQGRSTYTGLHRLIEKLFIGRASAVLAANSERAEMVKAHYKLRVPVVAIHNITAIKPSKSYPPEFSYLRQGGPYLVYQGHIGIGRGIDLLIQALQYCRAEVQLVLVIDGKGKQKLVDLVESLNLRGRVHIHEFMSPDRLYSTLKDCHLGLVFYDMFGPNNTLCAPNKLYEYAQCELPILSTPQNTFQNVFSRYKIGRVIDLGVWELQDPKALAGEISLALQTSYPQEEFQRFNAEYSWAGEEKKLKSVILGECKA